MSQTHDNNVRQRFELSEDGRLAFADYRLQGDVLVLTHVEADPALRGKGTAGRLMAGVLETARAKGFKVRPVCGYAVSYMQRHPECNDLME